MKREKNTKKKRIWIWKEDFGDESQSKRKKSGLRAVLNYWLPKIYWHLLCATNLMISQTTAYLLQCQ